MLSAEERRRLDEIERLLQTDDPDFVARMRAGRRSARRWPKALWHAGLWAAVVLIGVLGGWPAGLAAAGAAAMLVLGIAAVRGVRRRRAGWAGWPPYGAPPPGWFT